MNVQVISNTVQKFNGESFYLCGHYYQRKGKRLHRTVWEYHNGGIPKGYHVHHADGNKSNNDITNLVLLEKTEHIREHMNQPERREWSSQAICIAREYANKWHGSEAGKAFHSAQSKASWEKRKLQTYTCTECGKEFQTRHIYGEGQNHFCHLNCRAKYGRRHRGEKEATNAD
jgi:hypothetical protein